MGGFRRRAPLLASLIALSAATACTVQCGPPPTSMLVFDLDGNGLTMTSAADGVNFDLDADGTPERLSWTTAGSDDAILVIDANSNGRIDDGSEVIGRQFGDRRRRNRAFGGNLLMHDLQGIQPGQLPLPPDAGQLNEHDIGFARLRLWTDRNHDGHTDAGELAALPDFNVTYILTGFLKPKDGTAASTDAVGNRRLLQGSFTRILAGAQSKRQFVELDPLR